MPILGMSPRLDDTHKLKMVSARHPGLPFGSGVAPRQGRLLMAVWLLPRGPSWPYLLARFQ